MPTQDELPSIARDFDATVQYPFPGIIGALDGTHIPIQKPKENPQSYYCRKKYYSVLLQGLCDNRLMFRDIVVGWPGSCHDAKVLRNSKLWEDAPNLC